MRRFFQRKHGKAKIREQDAGNHGLGVAESSINQTPPSDVPVSPKIPPYGLKTLVSGEGDQVDIVFIHGLTGGRERTWTAPGAKFPWPRSLLPAELPAARILTFGYDADVTDLYKVVSQSRVGQHAMNLLSDLAQFRDSSNTSDRPLVFVCHSLGGLVCQNTLILSRQRTEAHLRRILSSTLGIAFMGCPLRGSGLADWAERLCRALDIVKQANADIIAVLRRESEVLSIIQDGFHALLKDRAGMGSPIQITCFYEELEFRGIGKIVSYESAVLSGEIHRSIHANHSDMTKFSSAEDPGFRAVTGELCRWVNSRGRQLQEETASQRSFSSSEYKYVSAFRPVSNLDLDDRVPGTCLWVLENDPYVMWTRVDRPAVLWLTGYAGCGKTILTNFIAQHLESQKAEVRGLDYVVCSFFFVQDTKSQSNAQSVAKSLIWQIVSAKKNVVKEIKTKLSEAKHGFEPSFEILWRIFVDAVSMLTCHSLYIIIDALDECEERSKKRLLSSIDLLTKLSMSSALSDKMTVKCFLSGQPKVDTDRRFFSNEVTQFHIDMTGSFAGLAKDANMFIDDKIEELEALAICSPSQGQVLRQALREKGENSFLWLKVVLDHVKASLKYHNTDLDRILAALPRTLRDSYSKYLPAIIDTEIPTLRKYLKLLVASLRPLQFVEIDALGHTDNHLFQADLSNEEDRILKASLQRAIGPLIKFSNGTVQFIHTTVRGFLLRLEEDQNHPLRATHGIDEAEAHLFCAVSSANYLVSNGIPTDIFDHNSPEANSFTDSPISPEHGPLEGGNDHDEMGFASMFEIHGESFLQEESDLNYSRCKAIEKRFKAYDYACWSWPYHWARAEHIAGDHETQQVIDLLSQRTPRYTNWYKYLFSSSLYKMPPPEKANPVVLSALFNLPRTLDLLLESEHRECSRIVLHEALYWAASRGNFKTVQVLLDYGAPVQMAEHRSLPLAIAAQEGSSEVCSMILKNGQADPNRDHDNSTFPIIIAASYDHVEILKLLLADERIQPDLTDVSGRSAFLEACRAGSARSVEAMLEDDRIEVNRCDRNGYGALHHAVLSGDELTVKEVLAYSTINSSTLTNEGRNAMSFAAQHGHLQIAKRLRRAGVSAAVADAGGRNAVSWAASSTKSTIMNSRGETVLRYLALKYPDAINAPDQYGWTPLAWTIDPPGYIIAVDILVKDGRADVNLADFTNSRPILAWAASAGHVDIVKYLLRVTGINKNPQSSDGRTPLSEAAANGHLEVVKAMLEDEEVLRDASDLSGKRPVDWAILGGHDEVAALLGQQSQGEDRIRHVMALSLVA